MAAASMRSLAFMTPLRLTLRLGWWALQALTVIGVAWLVVGLAGWALLRMFGL